MKPYEPFLQQIIFPQLEAGRPNWDKPHTQSVVKHLIAILEHSQKLKLDEDVLIIAAYAHDWGYGGLFAGHENLTFEEVLASKSEHMIVGAQKVAQLLTNSIFDFLTSAQKQRIIHLVRVHDQLNNIHDLDEVVLLEADTLGGLDAQQVKPTFDFDSNEKYLQEVINLRRPMFRTEYGKELFEKLVAKRRAFYAAYYSAQK